MGEPTGPDKVSLEEGFIKRVDKSFVQDRQLLLDDALNNALGLGMLAYDHAEPLLNHLEKPVKTYEEYLQRAWPQPGQWEYILSKSDPATVAEYNEKVAELNRDRKRIIQERDFQAVIAFSEALGELIERRRPE